jgi:ATP-dependent helicase/nuclease subunit B
MNSTTCFLSEFWQAHLLDKKYLVVPSYQVGHQIGEALAVQGGSWVNLHFVTLPSLAHEVSGLELSRQGLKEITSTTSLFLADKIFRELKEEGRLDYFGNVEVSSGIIRAIRRSLIELRMAGLRSRDISASSFIDEIKCKEITLFLRKYEEELEKAKLIDLPGVYSFAIQNIQTTRPSDEPLLLCLENQPFRKLEMELLKKIARKDLIVVPRDPAYGLQKPKRLFSSGKTEASTPQPATDIERLPWLFSTTEAPPPFKDKTLELFRAIGPANECREILRRIIYENLSLDKLEIIHPPGSIYPSLFHVLSAKAGLRVTYADGIAMTFTSPGKVFNGLADWLESNFQVSDLCRMIEGGDLRFPHEKGQSVPSPLKISRYLKNAMIGWDRTRYLHG